MKLTKVAETIIAEDSGDSLRRRITELEKTEMHCNTLWIIAPRITI
jgi:hypothetical protein